MKNTWLLVVIKYRVTTVALYTQTMLLIGVGILLLLLVGSTLSYLNTIDLIQQGQKQSNNELAEGLAYSLTDDVVSRDYGAIGAQLKLFFLNEAIYSILVVDLNGRVLANLQRSGPQGALVENFHLKTTPIPEAKAGALTELPDGRVVIWKRIESGMALGWLRIEISGTKIETTLSRLKSETILIASLAAALVIGMIIWFLLRIYPKLHRNEIEIEHENRLMEFDAMHDSLTHLPNRKLLMDRLQQAIFDAERKGIMLIVAFIDLDGFKVVNDQYGHEAGDKLLVDVKDRLLACFRRSDTVSRLGGDEFVVVLSDVTNWSACKKLLTDLPAKLAEPYLVKGDLITVIGASLGVSVYPQDGTSPDALIRHADTAMYRAKGAGKGCVSFFSEVKI